MPLAYGDTCMTHSIRLAYRTHQTSPSPRHSLTAALETLLQQPLLERLGLCSSRRSFSLTSGSLTGRSLTPSITMQYSSIHFLGATVDVPRCRMLVSWLDGCLATSYLTARTEAGLWRSPRLGSLVQLGSFSTASTASQASAARLLLSQRGSRGSVGLASRG